MPNVHNDSVGNRVVPFHVPGQWSVVISQAWTVVSGHPV